MLLPESGVLNGNTATSCGMPEQTRRTLLIPGDRQSREYGWKILKQLQRYAVPEVIGSMVSTADALHLHDSFWDGSGRPLNRKQVSLNTPIWIHEGGDLAWQCCLK